MHLVASDFGARKFGAYELLFEQGCPGFPAHELMPLLYHLYENIRSISGMRVAERFERLLNESHCLQEVGEMLGHYRWNWTAFCALLRPLDGFSKLGCRLFELT